MAIPGGFSRAFHVTREYMAYMSKIISLKSSAGRLVRPRLVYANITGAILGVYYVWGFQQNCRDQKALAPSKTTTWKWKDKKRMWGPYSIITDLKGLHCSFSRKIGSSIIRCDGQGLATASTLLSCCCLRLLPAVSGRGRPVKGVLSWIFMGKSSKSWEHIITYMYNIYI